MEITLKIIVGLFLAVAALVIGAVVGTSFGIVFGLEGLAMGVCQCLVAGFMLAQFVNVITE